MITAVFVYGTLKRGQCRSGLWPVAAVSVEPAWVHGRLFSRSDYPAMTAGDDQVLGELWRLAEGDMPQVLQTLDAIEGTNQAGQDDLYRRVILQAHSPDGRSLGQAYGYHYACDPQRDRFTLVEPTGKVAWVSWP